MLDRTVFISQAWLISINEKSTVCKHMSYCVIIYSTQIWTGVNKLADKCRQSSHALLSESCEQATIPIYSVWLTIFNEAW